MFNRLIKTAFLIAVFSLTSGVVMAQTGGGVVEADQDVQSGRFVDAEVVLTSMLIAHPDDADLLRRLSAVEAAQGHLAQANQTVDRALHIAPADHDIQLERAYILLWRGQLGKAKAQAEVVSAGDPHYPGLTDFHTALASRVRANEPRFVAASLTGGLFDVDFPGGAKATWKVQSASLSYAVTPATTLIGTEELESRAQTDVRLSGAVSQRFSGGSVYIGAAATPHGYFREKWSVFAGGEARLNARWTVIGDARYANYRTSQVGVIDPGLRYRPIPSLAITAQVINLLGGGKNYRIGGSVRVDYDIAHVASFYSTVASYPDTESDGTRQLRSVSVGAVVPISERWSIRLAGDFEKRHDSYLQRGVTLGLQWQFSH